jgi:ubiquinone biosynthesis protein UbiJ
MSHTFKTGVSDSIIARLVLLANHVIASEPAATARLRPHAGRQMELRFNHQTHWPLAQAVQGWLPGKVRLSVTPAGLLEWMPLSEGPQEQPLAPGSLSITVQVPDPISAVKLAFKRERPEVSIEGDVAFAEAMSWLMKNLRWDLEDDVARWLGGTPTQLLKTLADNVRAALSRWRPGSSGKTPGPFSR